MADAVITVQNLQKSYGEVRAVEDVSFEVLDGEIFGIVGPNGAGKTTTVECLQGLRAFDGGLVRVLGLDPATQAQDLRRHIGAQLQEASLPDRLKVREALDLFASFNEAAVDRDLLLEQWGLTERRNAAFGDLSGGQRQRLFLALAFINDPKLVFLDELTQGLDPQARRVTWELIRTIRSRGKTVVLVTHFMDEAEGLCDRVAVIDHGRVVALDTPQRLIAGLEMPTVVRFSTTVGISFLDDIPEVHRLQRDGEQVEIEGPATVLALVASALVSNGIVPADLRSERPTLESVFLTLTGQSIRE
jgi:ABC-2 type transport system ATP-binding protein